MTDQELSLNILHWMLAFPVVVVVVFLTPSSCILHLKKAEASLYKIDFIIKVKLCHTQIIFLPQKKKKSYYSFSNKIKSRMEI